MAEPRGRRNPPWRQQPSEDTLSTDPITSVGTASQVGITSPGPSFRGALASRDFSLLWIGQLGSEVGNGLVQLALPLVVYNVTGSAFQLATAYIVQFLPWLLFGLISGVMVDRWDRRLTIVAVEVIRAAAFFVVGLAFVIDQGLLSIELIYALIFLESTLQSFFNPARLALMPNLVKSDDLRAANSLMEVSRHIGFLVAPPVGILVVAATGPGEIILVDGITFLVSGLTVMFIKWRPAQRQLQQMHNWSQRLGEVLKQTQEGLGVIRRVRLLQVTLLLGFSLNLVVAPIQALLPLFVDEVKGQEDEYFAILVAAFVPGLIIGSLMAPALSRRTGLGYLAIGAVLVLGGVICAASFLPTLWLPVVAMNLAGTAIGALNVAQINMLQTSTTDEERGRVGAAYYTATLGVRSLGYLAVGALVAPAGVQALFAAFGVLVLAVGGFISRIAEVRSHH